VPVARQVPILHQTIEGCLVVLVCMQIASRSARALLNETTRSGHHAQPAHRYIARGPASHGDAKSLAPYSVFDESRVLQTRAAKCATSDARIALHEILCLQGFLTALEGSRRGEGAWFLAPFPYAPLTAPRA
jgi:hypothetical protein